LKFRATLWALKRVVFFADHSQSTAEADTNLAYWAMIVSTLNAVAAHAARLGQAVIRHFVPPDQSKISYVEERMA
jgi:hypothetical protein